MTVKVKEVYEVSGGDVRSLEFASYSYQIAYGAVGQQLGAISQHYFNQLSADARQTDTVESLAENADMGKFKGFIGEVLKGIPTLRGLDDKPDYALSLSTFINNGYTLGQVCGFIGVIQERFQALSKLVLELSLEGEQDVHLAPQYLRNVQVALQLAEVVEAVGKAFAPVLVKVDKAEDDYNKSKGKDPEAMRRTAMRQAATTFGTPAEHLRKIIKIITQKGRCVEVPVTPPAEDMRAVHEVGVVAAQNAGDRPTEVLPAAEFDDTQGTPAVVNRSPRQTLIDFGRVVVAHVRIDRAQLHDGLEYAEQLLSNEKPTKVISGKAAFNYLRIAQTRALIENCPELQTGENAQLVADAFGQLDEVQALIDRANAGRSGLLTGSKTITRV